MKRFLPILVCLVCLAPNAARAIDTWLLVSTGECVSSSTCSTTVAYRIDPGSGYVALYMRKDTELWQLLSCQERDPSVILSGTYSVPIRRQHTYKFRGNSQKDCNPLVVSGMPFFATGTDPTLDLMSTPASDSTENAIVWRSELISGVFTREYLYHYNWTDAQGVRHVSPAWGTLAQAQRFTRKVGEALYVLLQTGNDLQKASQEPLFSASHSIMDSCGIQNGLNHFWMRYSSVTGNWMPPGGWDASDRPTGWYTDGPSTTIDNCASADRMAQVGNTAIDFVKAGHLLVTYGVIER
jgi:hypothetical protein